MGFQSTLPRGERRSVRFRSPFSIRISIHAPTGGATEKGLIDAIMFEISIHAPTGGATKKSRVKTGRDKNFNPRSHGGSDGFRIHGLGSLSDFNPRSHGGSDFPEATMAVKSSVISIHAPTGGATMAVMQQTRKA